MGKSLDGMILTIFVSSSMIFAVCGKDTKQGHFQILQNHPDIKVCANDVLKENAYVGGRVSELTGKCYGLTHSWGLSPTIHNGYAYVKKTFVQENFQPPVENEPAVWMIPGVFHPGAKLDLFISMKVKENVLRSLEVVLSDRPGICMVAFYTLLLGVNGPNADIFDTNHKGLSMYDRVDWPVPENSKKIYKISFLAHSGSATILIDDKKLKTFQTEGMIGKRQICVKKWYSESPSISVHRIEFTAK